MAEDDDIPVGLGILIPSAVRLTVRRTRTKQTVFLFMTEKNNVASQTLLKTVLG